MSFWSRAQKGPKMFPQRSTRTRFEAFLVTGYLDSFEMGFYLSYMVVLGESIKKVFLVLSQFREPFWGGRTLQAATFTVHSSVTAQTWWQIDG